MYLVDLKASTCSCIVYQEDKIPYKHAITTIFAIPRRDLTLYMLEILIVET